MRDEARATSNEIADYNLRANRQKLSVEHLENPVPSLRDYHIL